MRRASGGVATTSTQRAEPSHGKEGGHQPRADLLLLQGTGARIQEALDLCPQAVRFGTPCSARLFGKGRKERVCPLWPETSALLQALLRRRPRAVDQPIFVNRYGENLGASGVRLKLAQYDLKVWPVNRLRSLAWPPPIIATENDQKVKRAPTVGATLLL